MEDSGYASAVHELTRPKNGESRGEPPNEPFYWLGWRYMAKMMSDFSFAPLPSLSDPMLLNWFRYNPVNPVAADPKQSDVAAAIAESLWRETALRQPPQRRGDPPSVVEWVDKDLQVLEAACHRHHRRHCCHRCHRTRTYTVTSTPATPTPLHLPRYTYTVTAAPSHLQVEMEWWFDPERLHPKASLRRANAAQQVLRSPPHSPSH